MSAAHEKILELAREVRLTVDALMQPIALLGNRGGGKTYGGTKIFELAHDLDVQCIAVDVIGKWWALRLGKDGKSKGLAGVYIFGGKHADFPVLPDKGAHVARVLVGKRIHAVLDLSLMRKGERQRFLADFLEEFYLLKKQEDVSRPCVLFVEEAHAVAPQQIRRDHPDASRMLGAIEDIAREGRNFGIGLVVMDQRPATVNKNVLALIEILIVQRTTYASDREVYDDWIVQKGVAVKLTDKLPFLKPPDAFLYAPMYDLFEPIKILPKKTYDASATARVGVEIAQIGKISSVDVEHVRESMAQVIADAEAKDPAALARRVRQLEHELAKASGGAPSSIAAASTAAKRGDWNEVARLLGANAPAPKSAPAPPPKPVEVPMLSGRELQRFETASEKFSQAVNKALGSLDQVRGAFDKALKTATAALQQQPAAKWSRPAPPPPPARAVVEHKTYQRRPSQLPGLSGIERQERAEDEKTPGDVRKLIEALALRHPTPVQRKSLGPLAGYKSGGSSFRRIAAAAKKLGLVEEEGGALKLTDAGVTEVGGVFQSIPTTTDGLLEFWRNKIPGDERKLFDLLVEVQPGGLSREELCVRADYTVGGSSFRRIAAALKRRGIVVERDGQLFASPELFESRHAA